MSDEAKSQHDVTVDAAEESKAESWQERSADFLGLLLTCAKLGISFWHYFGHRLAVPGVDAPYLPDLIRLRSTPACCPSGPNVLSCPFYVVTPISSSISMNGARSSAC